MKANQIFRDSKLKKDDHANVGSGIAVGLSVVGLLIALLIFAAVAPSLASGLNNTSAAFSGFPGVSGIIGVIPILLVVVILVAVAAFATNKIRKG